MQTRLWIIALVGASALAGCGEGPWQRGASGALIGAGAGEVIADDPVTGAAVGAGAGVLTD